MRAKFVDNPEINGKTLRLPDSELSRCGVNIHLLKSGGIQVYIMRPFELGDLKVEADSWKLSEESDIVRGLLNVVEEHHIIDPELFKLERELAHLTSDAHTLDRNGVAQRVIAIRDALRTTLRDKGYTGTF